MKTLRWSEETDDENASVGVIAPWGGFYAAIIHDDVPKGEQDEYAQKFAAAEDLIDALQNVNQIIAEASSTGFNYKDGDWAEKLFKSQQKTSDALKKALGHNWIRRGE